MSAYSDWKLGCITDDEYKSIARREQDTEERGCFDCYYADSCDSKGFYCPVKEGDWE